MKESKMVQVSIRVRSGSASISVRIVAASVERATTLVEKRFPGGDVRVLSSRELAGAREAA